MDLIDRTPKSLYYGKPVDVAHPGRGVDSHCTLVASQMEVELAWKRGATRWPEVRKGQRRKIREPSN